jgi:hypothetical protein
MKGYIFHVFGLFGFTAEKEARKARSWFFGGFMKLEAPKAHFPHFHAQQWPPLKSYLLLGIWLVFVALLKSIRGGLRAQNMGFILH